MIFTDSALTDLWILLTLALFVAHVWNLKRKRRWLIFDTLNYFWVAVIVIYVLETVSNYEVYVSWYGVPVVEETWQWIFFGLLFLHVGYSLGTGRQLAARLPSLPPRLSPNALLGASWS